MTDLRMISTGAGTSGTPDLAVVPDLTVRPAHPAQQEMPLATRHVMALLADGVPLSLLCDLADPAEPPSADMLSSESDSTSLIGDLLAFRADVSSRLTQRTLRLG